ncbi:MAG: type II toxin-antitoxin system Phd/YefM family antitoxin [Pseudomonadota bacterium]
MPHKLDIETIKNKNAEVLENHLSINARKARSNFSKVINTARIERERVIVTDYGEPAVAIIPIRDLKYLDLMDKIGVKDKIEEMGYENVDLEAFRKLVLTGKLGGAENDESDDSSENSV